MLHPPSLEDQGIRRLLVNRIPFIQYVVVEDLLPGLESSGTLDAYTCREIVAVGGRAEQAKLLLNAFVAGKATRRDWYHQLRLILKSIQNCPPSRQREYASLCNFMDNTVIFPSEIEERKWNGFNPLPSIRSNSEETVEPQSMGNPSHSMSSNRSLTNERISKQSITGLRRSNERTKAIIKALRHWQPSNLTDNPMQQTKLLAVLEEKKRFLKKYQKEAFFANFRAMERKVFKVVQRVETVLLARNYSPASLPTIPFYLCFSRAVDTMLEDIDNWLLYFKYLRYMEHRLLYPIIREMCSSFENFASDCGTPDSKFNRKHIIRVGFLLCDFLRNYGHYDWALTIVRAVQSYLSQDSKLLQAWIPIFYGHAKAIDVLTINGMISEAVKETELAESALKRVIQLSMGKASIDQAEYMAYQSHLNLTQGCCKHALDKAIGALRLMDPDPEQKYIHFPVLRANVLAHIGAGHIIRSEKLAIYFVQYTWKHFEGISTQYIQSLVTFLSMSNAFRRDDFAILVARNCVQYVLLLVGDCDVPILAEAYGALAETLERRCRRISASSSLRNESSHEIDKTTKFSDSQDIEQHLEKSKTQIQLGMQKDQLLNESVYWSEKALKMAKNCIPDNHYALTLYRLLFVECTLSHCENINENKSDNTDQLEQFLTYHLMICEKELVYATAASQNALGAASVPLARSKYCLARIRLLQNQEKEALSLLEDVEKILFTCLSSVDLVYLQFLVSYSRILRHLNQPQLGMRYLDRVIKSVVSNEMYLNWMNEAYANYIEMLSETHQKESCDEISELYSQWLASHSVLPGNIDWEILHQSPPKDFFRKWDIWDPKRILSNIDGLEKNLDEVSEKHGNLFKERSLTEVINRAQATTVGYQTNKGPESSSHNVLEDDEGTDDSDPDSSSSSSSS